MTGRDAVIDELVRLERAGELGAGLQRLAQASLPPDVLMELALELFYQRDLSAFPFIIAEQLLQAGKEHWLLRALVAYLGLRLGRPEAAAANIPRLAALLDVESDVERLRARTFLAPSLAHDTVDAFRAGRLASVRDLARLWAAIEPDIMRRLVPPPPDRRRDFSRLCTPDDGARLLRFDSPPPGIPRQANKAVLAIRRFWIPEQPNSREHEVPVRIAAAMSDYGWQPLRYHLRSFIHQATVTEDYLAIAALCRESEADVLILDEFQPTRDGNAAPGEILRALKHERPGLRLIGLYLDPWLSEQWDSIEAAADILDCFWTPVATALWQRPRLREKTLATPMPCCGGEAEPAPLRPELAFSGGVQYSNWYRAFWLTAIGDAGLPLRVELSGHQNEQLNGLDSSRAYMRRLGAMGAVLNLSLRSNGSPILTARTVEVLAMGGLLVQERADDIDSFFVAGRHYLRFETMTDLADIVDLLRTEPERVESIRRAGADFFGEHYADAKIIGYLDHFLFHRAARKAA